MKRQSKITDSPGPDESKKEGQIKYPFNPDTIDDILVGIKLGETQVHKLNPKQQIITNWLVNLCQVNTNHYRWYSNKEGYYFVGSVDKFGKNMINKIRASIKGKRGVIPR